MLLFSGFTAACATMPGLQLLRLLTAKNNEFPRKGNNGKPQRGTMENRKGNSGKPQRGTVENHKGEQWKTANPAWPRPSGGAGNYITGELGEILERSRAVYPFFSDPVCLSVCLYARLCVRLSVRVSVCLSVCMYVVGLDFVEPVCRSIYTLFLTVYMSVCLPACLLIYLSVASCVLGPVMLPIGVDQSRLFNT
jgi:hypothetical protein